jgi:hypothetical protein
MPGRAGSSPDNDGTYWYCQTVRVRQVRREGELVAAVSSKAVRSTKVATQEALTSGGLPVVIDDFHYIDGATQLSIVRFLKSLVFEGLPVIFVSVPHRAYDAVKVETEMTGRLKVLEVGFLGKGRFT